MLISFTLEMAMFTSFVKMSINVCCPSLLNKIISSNLIKCDDDGSCWGCKHNTKNTHKRESRQKWEWKKKCGEKLR